MSQRTAPAQRQTIPPSNQNQQLIEESILFLGIIQMLLQEPRNNQQLQNVREELLHVIEMLQPQPPRQQNRQTQTQTQTQTQQKKQEKTQQKKQEKTQQKKQDNVVL